MSEAGKVLAFRMPQETAALIEHFAKSRGETMSSYLLHNTLDGALNFESCRAIDTLTDFASITAGRFEHLGKESYTPEEITQMLAETQRVYITQRLQPFLEQSKRRCKVAVNCYLNDFVEDFSELGIDSFIINNCIVRIYDTLHEAGLITDEEWEDKTNFYNAYMSTTGRELLQQERSQQA